MSVRVVMHSSTGMKIGGGVLRQGWLGSPGASHTLRMGVRTERGGGGGGGCGADGSAMMRRSSPQQLLLRRAVSSYSSSRSAEDSRGRTVPGGRDVRPLWRYDSLERRRQTMVESGRRGMGTAAVAAELPPHRVIGLPKVSPTMDQGRVHEWMKKEGDEINPGDTLATIETDKSLMDFDLQEEGYLAKILIPEGDDAVLGQPICVIVDEQADVDAFKDFVADEATVLHPAEGGTAAEETSPPSSSPPVESSPAPSVETPVDQPPPAAVPQPSPAVSQPSSTSGDRIRASFRARVLSELLGISLQGIEGSGVSGSIIAADVEEAANKPGVTLASGSADGRSAEVVMPMPATSVHDEYTDVEVTAIRRAAATRAEVSLATIPDFFVTTYCNVDKVLDLLESWNGDPKKPAVSVAHVVMKACAVAHQKVPEMNSTFASKSAMRYFHGADINMEVQTNQGPVLPVIRNTAGKGLRTIAEEAEEARQRAQGSLVTAEEMLQGHFTFVDLSGLGVTQVIPMVTPNQAGALGLGAIQEAVQMDENGELKVTRNMLVTVTCNHRLIDGASAAVWLKFLKSIIEDPVSMLL